MKGATIKPRERKQLTTLKAAIKALSPLARSSLFEHLHGEYCFTKNGDEPGPCGFRFVDCETHRADNFPDQADCG